MTELEQMREAWEGRHLYSVKSSDGSTTPWTERTVATGLTWNDASAMRKCLEAAESRVGRTSWGGMVYFLKLERCATAGCTCSKSKEQIVAERRRRAEQTT